MSERAFCVILAAVALLAAPLHATELEQDARALEAMLIAPCCFSQQVSVHQSPAATDVRQDIRRRLAAGQSRRQILDAYVAQYGPRVLSEPPAQGSGRLLYLVPPLAFVITAGWIMVLVRRLTRSRPGDAGRPRVATSPDDERYRAGLDEQLRDLD